MNVLFTLLCLIYSASATNNREFKILTTMLPQKGLIESITRGISNLTVETVVDKNQSPEFFKPKPSLLKSLQNIDLYFSTAVPFEKLFISRVPKKKSIDLSKGTRFIFIGKKHKVNRDPHIWLSPNSIFKQLNIIAKTLESKLPQQKQLLEKNLQKSIHQLKNNIESAKNILRPYTGRYVLVFHPAFSYYLKYFKLKQIAIQEGHRISYRKLEQLPIIVKKHKIRTLFVQNNRQLLQIKNISNRLKLKIVNLENIPYNPIENILNMAKTIAGNI